MKSTVGYTFPDNPELLGFLMLISLAMDVLNTCSFGGLELGYSMCICPAKPGPVQRIYDNSRSQAVQYRGRKK